MNHHSRKQNGKNRNNNFRYTMADTQPSSSTSTSTTTITITEDDLGHVNNKNKTYQEKHYYYFGKSSTEIIVQDKISLINLAIKNLGHEEQIKLEAKSHCRTMNTLYGICQLITIPNVSHHINTNTAKELFIQILIRALSDVTDDEPNIKFMATMEYSTINNYHAHILYVDYFAWDKPRIKKFNEKFQQIKYQEDDIEKKTWFISRIEKCRSIASFMNYIKKKPLLYIAKDFQTMLSLEYYDREWFFDAATTTTLFKRKYTKIYKRK